MTKVMELLLRMQGTALLVDGLAEVRPAVREKLAQARLFLQQAIEAERQTPQGRAPRLEQVTPHELRHWHD